MAAGRIVVPSYSPARERNGRLVAGALLTVCENETTTKASIYSDEALTTPLANPVEANSSGRFPAVWAEGGTEEAPVLYSVSVTGPDGESIGNPNTFDNWRPSVDAETAQLALIEAAADQAAADAASAEGALAEIEDIVANAPDAPSVVNKLNRDGSNIGDDAQALRDSIGLGGSATLDVGTTAGTVAAGDDGRITGAAQSDGSNLINPFGETSRSVSARFNDVVDLRDAGLNLGGADDTAAFVAMVAKLATDYPNGVTVRGRASDVIRLSNTSPITFPPNIRWALEGARFIWDASLTSNTTPFIVEAGSRFDQLRFELPDGAGFHRFIVFRENCTVDLLEIVAETQTGTRDDNSDAAVKFSGSGCRIGLLRTRNIDFPLDSRRSDALPNDGLAIGEVDIDSYVAGCILYNCTNLKFGGGVIKTASPNTSGTAGYNALLIGNVVGATFGPVSVADAGEHGIRVAGESEDLTFSTVIIRRSGKCGFKANCDELQQIKNLNVGTLSVTDCAYANTTGENEDVLRLERVYGATFGQVIGLKDTKAAAGYDGVYIAGAADVSIGDVQLQGGVGRNAVRIEDGAFGEANARINIGPISGTGAGSAVVFLDSAANALEDIQIDVAQYEGGTIPVYARAFGGVTRVGVSGKFRGYSGNLLDANSLPIELDITDNAGKRVIGINNGSVLAAAAGDLQVLGPAVDLTSASRTVQGNLFIRSSGTPGNNAVGGTVVFSQINSGRPAAAIAMIQTSSDADHGGLGIYTHSSSTTTDTLTLSSVFHHNGYLRRIVAGSEFWDNAGAGSPEGVSSAGPGSTWRDLTNGKLYVKETGTGNTGWKEVAYV